MTRKQLISRIHRNYKFTKPHKRSRMCHAFLKAAIG